MHCCVAARGHPRHSIALLAGTAPGAVVPSSPSPLPLPPPSARLHPHPRHSSRRSAFTTAHHGLSMRLLPGCLGLCTAFVLLGVIISGWSGSLDTHEPGVGGCTSNGVFGLFGVALEDEDDPVVLCGEPCSSVIRTRSGWIFESGPASAAARWLPIITPPPRVAPPAPPTRRSWVRLR